MQVEVAVRARRNRGIVVSGEIRQMFIFTAPHDPASGKMPTGQGALS